MWLLIKKGRGVEAFENLIACGVLRLGCLIDPETVLLDGSPLDSQHILRFWSWDDLDLRFERLGMLYINESPLK